MFEEERYQVNKCPSASGQAIKGTVTGLATALLTTSSSQLSTMLGWGVDSITPLLKGAAGVLGLGVGAYLNQRIIEMEHNREEERMLDMYRKEIGAKLGRSPDTLTVEDLKTVAYGDAHNGIGSNATIADALERNDKKVSTNFWAWVGAATVALAVTITMFNPGAPLAFLLPVAAQGASAAAVLAAGLGGLAIKGLVSFLAFSVAKPIADTIGQKITKFKDHNTHDYVRELERIRGQGRKLTPEEVLTPFVKANPQVEAYVEERYGRTFEHYVKYNDHAILSDLVRTLDGKFNLHQITSDINSGRIRVTELAFASVGQKSGVPETEPDTRTGVEKAKEVVHEAATQVSHAWQHVKENLGFHKPESAPAVAPQSFQERFAPAGPASATSHLERVTHERAHHTPTAAGLVKTGGR